MAWETIELLMNQLCALDIYFIIESGGIYEKAEEDIIIVMYWWVDGTGVGAMERVQAILLKKQNIRKVELEKRTRSVFVI